MHLGSGSSLSWPERGSGCAGTAARVDGWTHLPGRQLNFGGIGEIWWRKEKQEVREVGSSKWWISLRKHLAFSLHNTTQKFDVDFKDDFKLREIMHKDWWGSANRHHSSKIKARNQINTTKIQIFDICVPRPLMRKIKESEEDLEVGGLVHDSCSPSSEIVTLENKDFSI